MPWYWGLAIGFLLPFVAILLTTTKLTAIPGWYGILFRDDRPFAVFTQLPRMFFWGWRVIYLPNTIGLYTDVYVLNVASIIVAGDAEELGVTFATFAEVLRILRKYERRTTEGPLSPEEDAAVERWYRRMT